MSDVDVERPEPASSPAMSSPGRARVAPFVALAVAAVLAGLFVVLAGADPTRNETADTFLMDKPAPAATGERGDGSTFDLAREKGGWVVLNFFQSSCVPCRQEHPDLVQFADQQSRSANPVRLVTIVFDDDRDRVEDFFATEGGDWPVVYDDDGEIATSFGVSKVPETWIIDANGVVRERFISLVTADFLATQLTALGAYG